MCILHAGMLDSPCHRSHSNGSFHVGDRVSHRDFGLGMITSEWGGEALQGVYEVEFSDKPRSINKCNLTLVSSALAVHPLAAAFPRLSADDYSALRASIKKNGLYSPIVLSSTGTILDGVHRHRVCLELGVEPRFIQFSELQAKSPELSEAEFVYLANLVRRHLTQTQKAALSLHLLPAIQKESAARARAAQARGLATQKLNRLNGKATNGAPLKCPRLTSNGILAKKAGVSEGLVAQVVLVQKHAPELLPKLESGDLSAPAAIKVVADKRQSNGTKPIKPASLKKKAILQRFETFLKQYPMEQRDFVRKTIFDRLNETSVACC
jgi:ParB-like chromosome segregation protein Spo0J